MIRIVRHAETTWNCAPKRFQGHSEAPLSPNGIRKAALLSKHFSAIQRVYSSPLFRCRKTAELLVPHIGAADFRLDERLMEIDNGWYGGNTVDEVKAIDEENYRQWIESPGLCRPGGGENLDELAKRVTSGVLSIVEAWCGEPTLVVTHGGPIRVLKGDRLDFSDFHKIEVENLGVYSVQKGHEDAIALKREFIS